MPKLPIRSKSIRSKSLRIGLVAVILMASCAAAEEEDAPNQKQKELIDRLFKKWDRNNSPGAAIGIIEKGKLVYSNGFGLANLEHPVAIDSSYLFTASDMG